MKVEEPVSAVEQLFAEHRLIERVVDALELFIESIESVGEEQRCELVRIVTFFREYADLGHHEKEETLLIPALVASGLRWEEGLLHGVTSDHERERYLLQTLRHAALQHASWTADERAHIIEVARTFVSFMRRHIAMEDDSLLTATRTQLSDSVRAGLELSMARFDARRVASGEQAMLIELGEDLARRYCRPKA